MVSLDRATQGGRAVVLARRVRTRSSRRSATTNWEATRGHQAARCCSAFRSRNGPGGSGGGDRGRMMENGP